MEVTMGNRRGLIRIIREYQPGVLVTHDPWMRYRLPSDHRACGTEEVMVRIHSHGLERVVNQRDLILPLVIMRA